MADKTIVPGCYDDLDACLAAPLHCVPTVEYRLINFELPLGKSDVDLLGRLPLNIFVADPSTASNKKFASSNAVSQDSLKILGSFLLLGICVHAYGEGMGMNIEGAQAFPHDEVDGLFASPQVVRNGAIYTTQLGLPEGASIEMSEVNFGNPVWNAIADFMRGYKLKLSCPENANAQLLEEPVSELGNCCALIDYQGFGRNNHGIARIQRQVNDRLDAIAAANDETEGAPDVGRFVATNAMQGPALGPEEQGDLIPTRPGPEPVSFGRLRANPNIAYWYKLPCALPVTNGTLLKIEFTSDEGNLDYITSMIRTAVMQTGLEPFAGSGANYPTYENLIAGTARGTKTRIPAGRLRLGIGLKGFKVSPNVCNSLAQALAGSGKLTTEVLNTLCAGRIGCGG